MNMSNNEWNIAKPEKKYASTNENVPNKINVAGKVHFGHFGHTKGTSTHSVCVLYERF